MDTNDLYIIDNFCIKKSLTVENFLCYSPYQSKACFVYCYITKSKHLCKAYILTTGLFFPFYPFCSFVFEFFFFFTLYESMHVFFCFFLTCPHQNIDPKLHTTDN